MKVALALLAITAFALSACLAEPQLVGQGPQGQDAYGPGPFGGRVSQGPGGQGVWNPALGTYVRQGPGGQEIWDARSNTWVSQGPGGQVISGPYPVGR